MSNLPPNQISEDCLLTVPDAAKILSMSRAKTYRLLKHDVIDSVQIGGNRRLRKSDIMRYIADHKTVRESKMCMVLPLQWPYVAWLAGRQKYIPAS